MTDLQQILEDQVRRAEPDLWLTSRLVSEPAARSALIALYAVHVELSKVAAAASNPLAGEIRLAWWREEVEAMAASRPLGHPALQALQGAPGMDHTALDLMIEARHLELELRPFADEAVLVAYFDGVDGALMRAASGLLGAGFGAPFTHIGRAWGWARLMRERAAWRARGRDWAPSAWGEASAAELAAHVRHRVTDALAAAKGELAALPVSAFPAVAYATLAASYARGRNPSELEKRGRLIWASLRGRI